MCYNFFEVVRMAIDGVFLNLLIKELTPNLLNGKIRKINQINKNDLIFSIRCNGNNFELLMSVNSKYSTINITNVKHKNSKSNFMFSTILKKYVLNGTIIGITQIENDRIVKLIIENRNELGDLNKFELIIEIMGKHSNISLVEFNSQKVLDSIKHLSLNNNSYRKLLPGSIYKYPPKDDLKLNPYDFNIEKLSKLLNIIEMNESMYSKIFQGVSITLSKFIFELILNKPIEQKFQMLSEIFNDFKISPILYKKNEIYKDFYCFDIDSFEEKTKFDSLNQLLDDFIYKKNKFDNLNGKLLNLQKIITSKIQKIHNKINLLEVSLKQSENKDIYKLYGDLISSNIYMLKGEEEILNVQNYFSENYENVSIKLNPKLNASQNIDKYYKKYKKLKKSEIINKSNIEECKKEIEYLNSVLLNLENIHTENEIDEIKNELSKSGYIKNTKSKNKSFVATSSPHHYITSGGVSIFVGKNNIQNELLTFKLSKKDHIWFHTKNIPGSHVVLAHNNPNEKLIELAGQIAAFHSKASSSSNVPIDYTKIKNVKKMPHAKPGMVIYTSQNTVYVTPPQNLDELNLTLKD